MSKFRPDQSVAALDYQFGTRETNTITMPAVGSATQGDYVTIYNAAGQSYCAFIDIDSNGTAPTGALYAARTGSATLAYKNAVQETYVITLPTTAAASQAHYIMIYDEAGNSTAIWLDIDAAGTVPTGALYVASDNQIEVDIVTGGTAAQNGTLFYNAVNGNVTNVSFTDNLNGTVTVLLDNAGPASAAAVPKNANDSAAGSISVGAITAGVLATTDIAGGALLAAASFTDITLTDNADGTVLVSLADVGNATNAVPKTSNDGAAGSITVSASNGSSESFPYENPGDSPTARKVIPDAVS